MDSKKYCTQKDIQDCRECSLSNYDRDCYNLPITTKWVLKNIITEEIAGECQASTQKEASEILRKINPSKKFYVINTFDFWAASQNA